VGGAESYADALQGLASVLTFHSIMPDPWSGFSLIAAGRRSADADASDQRLFEG